ncbi:MAG: glucosamine-6-phosphate deaminase [Victivallales bacterium]|nr:glucosamine-6-phosphate deaminase [Victivallales bacterium]
MKLNIFKDKEQNGAAAAAAGAELIRQALAERAEANIIVATGASQFDMLSSLVKSEGIDWSRVRMFHLDEYVGLPETHPASFRKYLKERFVDQLPEKLLECNFVDGGDDPEQACIELDRKIRQYPVDVAFVGIGENGHLAFNDPPADFELEQAYIVVELDEACRKQQLGEGWFPSLEDVPRKAISMSIKHIMKSKAIICTVPDARKAEAVRNSLKLEVSNLHPASILQRHEQCLIFVDEAAASLL